MTAQWIIDLNDAQLYALLADGKHFAHAELTLEAIYRESPARKA